MSKRIPIEDAAPEDLFNFVALGGGSEVGRSCHIISYKGKTVMLDAGVHPAYSGLASLPFYDEFDLSTVDILLISHFHVDHAASLPYVMQHTNFKGRVFMTHPTKAIYRWLLNDFVKVSSIQDSNESLYSENDLSSSFDKIETIDYHSTLEVEGIKFTAYHAGHVLGAAMYFIEIGGVKVLFTGDYSREKDRHLMQAEVPKERPDILICESTYGTGVHQPRQEKEARLTSLIHSTINKGGRCLLPVFALGRAQEILLILEEYWDSHPELDSINIYYASSLARKCMAVYQTYINMMNENIQAKFRDSKSNPFHFKHIKSIRSLEKFDDIGPSVMIASPGMLQNGVSRQLLERWAPDPRNALIITGYSVEGTMAKQILNQPLDIPAMDNPQQRIPRRLSIEELSFAAHVDFQQNSDFIDQVNAPYIILVHGESNAMGRLKSALMSKYMPRKGTDEEVKIYNPSNCFEVELPFKSTKIAKTHGILAKQPPTENEIISGVLVEKDFRLALLTVQDLREYGLTTSVVMERQTIIVSAGPDLVKYHLEQMFGSVEVISDDEDDKDSLPMSDSSTTHFRIMDAVSVYHGETTKIEWIGNIMSDAIADAVLAVLLTVDSSPASVKMSSKSCSHTVDSRLKKVKAVLKAQFGDSFTLIDDENKAEIKMTNMSAVINFDDLSVECSSAPLKQRVAHVLELAVNSAAPLAQQKVSSSKITEIKEENGTGEDLGPDVKPEVKQEVKQEA